MNKKMKYLFIFIAVLTVVNVLGINGVSAKKIIHTCEYVNSDKLGEDPPISTLCYVFEDYSHDCYVEAGTGRYANINSNKESILNWKGNTYPNGITAKEYIKNNNKCPGFILAQVSSLEGYAIYATATREEASLLDKFYNEIDVSIVKPKRYILTNTPFNAPDEPGIDNKPGIDNEIESGCHLFGENMTPIIKWAIRIIYIAVPILIIILTIVSFIGVVLSGEEKNFKEVINKLVKRLLIGVAILLLPALLTFIIDMSGALQQYGIEKGDLYCSLFK